MPDSSVLRDLKTHDGLRAALRDLPTAGGWDGPLGRRIVEQIRVRAVIAARRARTQGDVVDHDLVDTLVTNGWEIMATRTAEVIAAERPWGFLMAALLRGASGEVRATEMVTSPRKARSATDARHRTPARYGLHDVTMVTADPTGEAAATSEPLAVDDWDDALVTLHQELVDRGAPADAAREAINAGLDVLNQTTRRSHVHFAAYRDERLTATLDRPRIRALMDLLIGPRRAGPAGSAWLALREAARAGKAATITAAHPVSLTRVNLVASAWRREPDAPATRTVPAGDQMSLFDLISA